MGSNFSFFFSHHNMEPRPAMLVKIGGVLKISRHDFPFRSYTFLKLGCFPLYFLCELSCSSIFYQHRWSRFHVVMDKKKKMEPIFEKFKAIQLQNMKSEKLSQKTTLIKHVQPHSQKLKLNSYVIWLRSKWGSKLTYFSNFVTKNLLNLR